MMSLATDYAEPAAQLVAWGACFLVQSTLLIALGLAACGLLRQRSAALRSMILRGTLLAVLICPVVSEWGGLGRVGIVLPQRSHVVPASSTLATSRSAGGGSDRSIVRVGSRVSVELAASVPAVRDVRLDLTQVSLPVLYLLLSVLWGVGAAFLLSRSGFQHLRVRKLRRGAGEAPEHATDVCRNVAERMGMKAPRVMASPAVRSPLLIGISSPVIVLPETSPDMANAQVFAHELAHVWRRDCLWNAACRMLTNLCFFQPLLWTLACRAEQVNEEACDDFVLSYVGQRRSYAWRLIDMAQALGCCPAEPVGVGAVGLRSALGRRIQRIVSSGTSHTVRAGRSEKLYVALLVCLAVFAVSLIGVRATVSGGERGAFSDKVAANLLPQIHSLESDDWQTREQAAITLAQMSGAKTQAIPALIDALADEQWQVRKAAAVALITVPPGAKQAVPALITAVQDEEWQVRRPAAEALAVIGPASAPAVPALANALDDNEWQVRRAVATALAAIGPGARLATPQLLRTLGDEQWHVRESAALALGAIGPAAAEAIPSLMKELDDPQWQVRRAAASALGKIAPGNKAAIPEIIGALRDPEWQRRQAAAESLERLL